jgi:hypothetical protein
MDKTALIALIQAYIGTLDAHRVEMLSIAADLQRPYASEVDIQSDKAQIVTKLISHGQSVSSLVSAVPSYSVPASSPGNTNPISEPLSMLSALTSTVDDIANASTEILNVVDFTAKYAAASPDDRKRLSYDSLFTNGWSLKVDMNGDGKTAELFNGRDVVRFLTSGVIGGDALTEEEILLGVTSKFEKELFGFSVVEIAQDVETLAKNLTSGNVSAEELAGNITDKIENILTKTGGNNEYVNKIKNTVELSKGLISAYNKAKMDVQTAVSFYNSSKDAIASGSQLFDPPTTTLAPDEIPYIPETTTLPSTQPTTPETGDRVDTEYDDPFEDGDAFTDEYP